MYFSDGTRINLQSNQVKKVVIVGGGTAGWMTAAALSKKFAQVAIQIELVESDTIGTVGVGEATLPHIRFFNETLGIDERTFMRETQATFKLGIELCDWGRVGDRYIHPFGDYGLDISNVPFYQYWLKLKNHNVGGSLDDYAYVIKAAEQGKFSFPNEGKTKLEQNFSYAYQFDSSLYTKFLRRYAEQRGVIRTEGKVINTQVTSQGTIESILLEGGRQLTADLYIDCSGFRGLLIEQALQTGYDDWSKWLPCDRAISVPCESVAPLTPFTRATARQAGWQWRIPLQHRTGNGYVYASQFISDEEASQQLLNSLDAPILAEPKQLFFKTGRRKVFWKKNVVAIGLSAGFLEPLESTSIHLIQAGITALIELFPHEECHSLDIAEYNYRMGLEFERIRDFLLLHYVATERDDSEMWRYFRNMILPDSLQSKIDCWKQRGYIPKYEYGVFRSPSWVAVMLGQNLLPKAYDPRVNNIALSEVQAIAKSMKMNIENAVESTMEHAPFIRKLGAASLSCHIKQNS